MLAAPRSPRLITLGRLTLLDAAGVEDRELATRKRKLVLLAVLALSPHPLTRDALIDLFWGEQPEERARHSLSDALSHLRRVLGPDAITQRRTEVGLGEVPALTVDVLDLHEAARRQAWSDVVAIYSSSFLNAVHVGGSPRLEQWIDSERRRASTTFSSAAKLECERLLRSGNAIECAILARKWLDEAPTSPHAALFRLRAVTADGGPESAAAALAEYEHMERVLRDEFGTRPDQMVADLAQELANGLTARVATIPVLRPAPVTPDTSADTDSASALPLIAPATDTTSLPAIERAGRLRWRSRVVPMAAALAVAAALWAGRTNSATVLADADRVSASRSPEALALYQRAIADYERDNDRALAIARLDSAIRLDSGFALAYRRLASIYGSGTDERHRYVLMLTKAAEYADRLPAEDRLLALGAYHTNVTHDYTRAAGYYRELLASAPTEPRAWINLGVVYDYLGDRRRAAEAYERGLALDPKRVSALMNLADARYDLGDVAGAWRALDTIAARFPGHPSLFMRTAAVALSEGDTVRAEAQLRALIAAAPEDAYLQSAGHMLLAKALWAYGRLSEGDSVRLVGVAHDRRRGSRDAVLVGLLEMAFVDVWVREDPMASLNTIDRPYLDLVTLQALTHDVRAARSTYAAYEREMPALDRRDRTPAEHRALGVLLAAEARYRDAISTLRSAADPLCAPCGVPELGWVYLRAGHADSAQQVHERYVALRSSRKLDATDAYHRARIAKLLRRSPGDRR